MLGSTCLCHLISMYGMGFLLIFETDIDDEDDEEKEQHHCHQNDQHQQVCLQGVMTIVPVLTVRDIGIFYG